MQTVLFICILFLAVASVIPDNQICQEPDENAFTVIRCGGPGKNGLPGTKGDDGAKGEKGNMGPFGFEGNKGQTGPKGDLGSEGGKGYKGDIGETGLESRVSSLELRVIDLQSKIPVAVDKHAKLWKYESAEKNYTSLGLKASFDHAKTACANAGGQLATPRNEAENEIVLSLCNRHGHYAYLGIHDIHKDHTFRYPNGEAITYSNWNPGEPNNYRGRGEHCVAMHFDGKWNDVTCAEKHLVICEF
ncbi:mannose-binding protein-like [Hyperolius riggenbachi]|uniref:mannose-binding protein-like n=1 Tax=Hyperolius riggenbachi TaxID=752182 RepID=UPI0035A35EC1